MAMMERHHGQWSHRVNVGKYSAFEVPSNDIVITNVSLGADLLGDERSVLFVHHRILDAPPDSEKKTQAAAVACLTPGKVEFASIHLVLNRREPIAFEVTGDNDIYLFGHYTSYNKLPSSSSYTASSFEGNSQVYSTQGSSVSARPGQDGSASSQAGPSMLSHEAKASQAQTQAGKVCDPHQTSSFAVDGVLARAAVGCMLPTLTAQRKTPDLLHIETPLAQTPADDALDSPSAFAPHISDIQSPKCLPLLGENAVNLDSSQCVNRLVRAPFDLKLSCVRRSVVCSPRSLRSAKMPELLHLDAPLAQTLADDALDGPSAFEVGVVSYHFKELKREVFGRVTQCRIGHGYTGEYYSRRKFVPSEGVDCPSEEFQSREHILRECPRYEDQRHILEAVSRDISLPEILSTKEGIADEDDEDEVFLQRPSNPQQPLPIENWHLQPDCLHLLDGRVRSTLPPMRQSLVRRARTPGLHRASSVPFPPSIESNAPISSDLTVAWYLRLQLLHLEMPRPHTSAGAGLHLPRSLSIACCAACLLYHLIASIHLETPLAQTPADDALDGPSAFARRVFDIQSTKCHPLLNEDVQNSPMPSSPPVRIVGGASGRLRPQIDLSQLPWAPHGATFPAPSSWTVVALITPAVLETGARTTSILAMSRTSSCPRPRSVPAALRDELVAALGNACFACTACSTRSIAGHAKYVSAAWTFPTLRGHHHREVWMRFLCHVTDAPYAYRNE
ncbi:hypothetical protein C8R46DRAFT_1221998 [Mycena filopes]|nr:hypothetical protein C8R46DRAFT_1221998 [Mycena filopes]